MFNLIAAQESLEDSILLTNEEIFDLLCEATINLGFTIELTEGNSECRIAEEKILIHNNESTKIRSLAHELVHAKQNYQPLGWEVSVEISELVENSEYVSYYRNAYLDLKDQGFDLDVEVKVTENLIMEMEAIQYSFFPIYVANAFA